MAEFDAQDGGLQRVQAAVDAMNFVKIFLFAAVNAKHLETLGHGGIVGGDQAAIAGSAEIFGRKETEAAKIAEGSGEAAVVARADGLRGVFHDKKIFGFGDGEDGSEIGGKPEEMDGHDGFGVCGDGGFDIFGIEIEGDGIDVDEDGLGAELEDGAGGGNEAEGSGDDLVAGTYAGGHESED